MGPALEDGRRGPAQHNPLFAVRQRRENDGAGFVFRGSQKKKRGIGEMPLYSAL